MNRAYRAFSQGSFVWFSVFRAFATTAMEIVMVAVGWQAYLISGSAFALGMVGLVQAIPVIGCALWAGHLADRANRRNIIFFGNMLIVGCALLLAWLTASQRMTMVWLYAVLAAIGTARAFMGPAASALMPSLVSREDFPSAVGWTTGLFHVFSVVGPALGGWIIAWAGGVAYAYAAAALLGLGGLLSLWRLQVSKTTVVPKTDGFDGWLGGIKFLWTRQELLGVMSLDLAAVFFGGATALFPVFARDILFVGPQGLGLLRAAQPLGAAVTAIALAHRPLTTKTGTTFFVCVAVYGFMMIGFGLSTSFLLSLALLVASGMADSVSVVIRHTLIQTLTPDHLRGRLSAVNGVFIQSSNKIGEFESGVAAAWLGTAPSVVVGGLFTIGTVFAAARLFPSLKKLGSFDQLKPAD